MTEIVITRNQYQKIKEVFEQYDIDHVEWNEESPSGIGPTVKIKFHNKLERPVEIDITDFDSW
jgi:hypothetical protein